MPFDIIARLVLSTYFLTNGNLIGVWSRTIERSDFLHILWSAWKSLESSKPEDMVYSFPAFDNLPEEF